MIPIPGLTQIKLYAILTVLTVISLTVAGTIWYINRLEAKVDTLKADNALLNDAVKMQTRTIELMQADMNKIRMFQDDVRRGVNNNNKDLEDLRKRFEKDKQGQQRDFGALAVKDPSAVQRAVNKGVAEANRCLEIASGAPLTEKEKNAKLKTEINSICPSLANPNFKPTGN